MILCDNCSLFKYQFPFSKIKLNRSDYFLNNLQSLQVLQLPHYLLDYFPIPSMISSINSSCLVYNQQNHPNLILLNISMILVFVVYAMETVLLAFTK
jgi:hypothetical protein